jgi:GTP:adenosylcobinamide-phosphate guanylyltransferase
MNNIIATIAPMDAIITAGGIPVQGEPLFERSGGKPKALMNFAGKPMIQWVLDALSGSQYVRQIIIVGLPPFTELHCGHPLTIIDTQGSILGNLQAGVRELQRQGEISQKVLAVSSDIPAISADMVNWVITKVQQTDHDLYYNVITRETMEATFPASKRTYIKLSDVEICGGDINAFDYQMVFQKQKLFEEIIATRKNPLKQASILGFDTLFLILIKKMTLLQAEINISKKIESRGHAILCPFAEIGMDIDKPHQMDQLLSYFRSLKVASL